SNNLPSILFLVFCPVFCFNVIFLQVGEANVHIAAIVFFDMLLEEFLFSTTSVPIKTGRGNG
ncbi:hypothetical protein CJ207_25490, partial [Klebsiella aerogenes]